MNKTELLPDRPGIPPMAKLPDPEVVDPAALARAYAAGDIDLICVVGPTASGKTRYAVQLAHALGNAEILSADSRQVYIGMDIGTGKDLREYGDVPYHLIGMATLRPLVLSAGRSICVMSPVMTTFEPKPMRVRNIFICSREVFCASSRMMKLSSSVRPRI